VGSHIRFKVLDNRNGSTQAICSAPSSASGRSPAFNIWSRRRASTATSQAADDPPSQPSPRTICPGSCRWQISRSAPLREGSRATVERSSTTNLLICFIFGASGQNALLDAGHNPAAAFRECVAAPWGETPPSPERRCSSGCLADQSLR
jgi:hypothetical protein